MIYWDSSEAFAAKRRGAYYLQGTDLSQYAWAQSPVTFHTPGKVAGALTIISSNRDDQFIVDASATTRALWPTSFPQYPAANFGETSDVYGLIAPRMVVRVAQPGPYSTQIQVRGTFYFQGQSSPQSAGAMALSETTRAPFSIAVQGRLESNGAIVTANLRGELVFDPGLWTWSVPRYTPTVTLPTGFVGATPDGVTAFSFD